MLKSIVLVMALMMICGAAQAATYYADPGTGGLTISQAVALATTAGDVVILRNGTYSRQGDADVLVTVDITIRSESNYPDLCIIDLDTGTGGGGIGGGSARDERRAFHFQGVSNQAMIRGIKITGGQWHICDTVNGCGGAAIYCDNSSPVIYGCEFETNDASNSAGGAILAEYNSYPSIEFCVFDDNIAGTGGAFAARGVNSGADFEWCIFESNESDAGAGAVAGVSGDLNFSACTFENNRGSGHNPGGAIWAKCDVNLSACVFIGNSSQLAGGAIYCSGDLFMEDVRIEDCYSSAAGGAVAIGMTTTSVGSLIAENCVFSNNSSLGLTGQGGALSLSKATEAILFECTFDGNTATTGGGIYLASDAIFKIENSIISSSNGSAIHCYDYSASVTMSCCDIYNNSGGDYIGCLAGMNGTYGNISSDPQYCGTLNTEPFTLMTGSPCLVTCGIGSQIGAFGQGCNAIKSASIEVPSKFNISAAPNPFNPSTEIQFRTNTASHVVLSIYNLAGRKIVTLNDSFLQAQKHTFCWNGKDGMGRNVESGVYLVSLRSADQSATTRIVMLK